MKSIHRTSDTLGIKGSIPIRIETLHPKENYTLEEQVILLYLLSLPPKWDLKQNWVIKKYDGIIGRNRVQKAWVSLKLKGHLVKQRGTKFTDVNWLVYETPINNRDQDNQNPVHREPVNKDTNTRDTNIIDTDITSTSTGTSILGKNLKPEKQIPEHLKFSISTQGSFTKNEFEECSRKLVGATSIGADIFLYDSEFKMKKLEKLIGAEKMEEVESTLLKWIRAKNRLNG